MSDISAGVDSTPLDLTDDHFDVQSELTPVAARWKNIGLALRLNPATLGTIHARNNGDPTACLDAMVTDWLEKNYNVKKFGPPTWKSLVDAVGHPAGGANMALAEKIAKSHKAEAFPPVPSPAVEHVDEYAGLRYEPKLIDLMNEIAVKLPGKWQDIGRGLGLEEHELKQIEVQDQTINNRFSSLFTKWRNGRKSPYTWEQVLKALYQPTVEGNWIADELKKKYRK